MNEFEIWNWFLENGATEVVLKPEYVEGRTGRTYYRVECAWPILLPGFFGEFITATYISGEGYTVLEAFEDMKSKTALYEDWKVEA